MVSPSLSGPDISFLNISVVSSRISNTSILSTLAGTRSVAPGDPNCEIKHEISLIPGSEAVIFVGGQTRLKSRVIP